MDRLKRGQHLIAQLEELVVEVLMEAGRNNELLGPAEINRRAGIWLPETVSTADRDWVGTGILSALEAKGLVRKVEGTNGKRELTF